MNRVITKVIEVLVTAAIILLAAATCIFAGKAILMMLGVI